MGKHALLSASSSHRWLACPPSARLCEDAEDTGSEYARQGTDAHSLCEHKLREALGLETTDPTENLAYYDSEMEDCASEYAAYVMSIVAEAHLICKGPVVLIEERLDFSRYVESGFGTGDCVIVTDGTLYIIDYKHGMASLRTSLRTWESDSISARLLLTAGELLRWYRTLREWDTR